MKFPRLFIKSGLILCLAAFCLSAHAQKSGGSAPRQEKLLNGLKVLMWSDPSATEVRVSIRVHSGSAFDPQGKEGVMQLLADNIFPTKDSRSYFSDDLGGSIDVLTNYDYIQVSATAKPSEFVTLVETLAQAISSPTIDKETTALLKKALLEKLTVLEKDPVYVSDQVAAQRLFGTFPYGRPQMGSVESIQRIDYADLLFARERLFSADNATVAISGNFNTDLAFRAVRRYFGAWLKSDKRVPSTFRQPDDPDQSPAALFLTGVPTGSVFGLRGLSKSDTDYAASVVLERIISTRLQKNDPKADVAFAARTLPGMVRLRTTTLPATLFTSRITPEEFAQAMTKVNEVRQACEQTPNCAAKAEMDRWLDADTYGGAAADLKSMQSVTLNDVQRVADRLAKNPVATVIINPPAKTE